MKAREKPLVRPPFETIYMELAANLSLRSTCRRLGVGCAIVSADFQRVLSIGYNGNAAGLPNDCDSEEPGSCGCLHAEDNAIIKCREPSTTPKIVFCTHLPCKACAKRIINLGGVKKVIYLNDYRLKESIQLLKFVETDIVQYDPNRDKETVA